MKKKNGEMKMVINPQSDIQDVILNIISILFMLSATFILGYKWKKKIGTANNNSRLGLFISMLLLSFGYTLEVINEVLWILNYRTVLNEYLSVSFVILMGMMYVSISYFYTVTFIGRDRLMKFDQDYALKLTTFAYGIVFIFIILNFPLNGFPFEVIALVIPITLILFTALYRSSIGLSRQMVTTMTKRRLQMTGLFSLSIIFGVMFLGISTIMTDVIIKDITMLIATSFFTILSLASMIGWGTPGFIERAWSE